jgi:hypothetical protein
MAHDEKWFRKHVVDSCIKAGGYAEVMGSMIKNGIADVHVARRGASMWLELKFVELPPLRPDSEALGHPFSGPQVRFLRDITLHGGLAFGLVGIQMSDGIWVSMHSHTEISKKGQLTLAQVTNATRRIRFDKNTIGEWVFQNMADAEARRRHEQPVPSIGEVREHHAEEG